MIDATEESLPVVFRAVQPEDTNFILSSWLRSHEPDERIDRKVYFKEQEALIRKLLATAEVVVASDPDDTNHVYGYACGEYSDYLKVLHMCFVKPAFRKLGLARELMKRLYLTSPDFVTHYSRDLKKLKLDALYDPYLARST